MDIDKAVYDRMVNDPTLAAMLATYDGESAGPVPAVFTGAFVPENALPPYIWSYGNVTDVNQDTKIELGRDIVRDIGCYAANDGDPAPLHAIAERVRTLFHRHSLVISGAVTVIASATGPVPAETDQTRLGKIVHIRLQVEPT